MQNKKRKIKRQNGKECPGEISQALIYKNTSCDAELKKQVLDGDLRTVFIKQLCLQVYLKAQVRDHLYAAVPLGLDITSSDEILKCLSVSVSVLVKQVLLCFLGLWIFGQLDGQNLCCAN